jgi:hypothetical protein
MFKNVVSVKMFLREKYFSGKHHHEAQVTSFSPNKVLRSFGNTAGQHVRGYRK